MSLFPHYFCPLFLHNLRCQDTKSSAAVRLEQQVELAFRDLLRPAVKTLQFSSPKTRAVLLMIDCRRSSSTLSTGDDKTIYLFMTKHTFDQHIKNCTSFKARYHLTKTIKWGFQTFSSNWIVPGFRVLTHWVMLFSWHDFLGFWSQSILSLDSK